MAKKLELRELQTDDAFLLSEIVDKTELDIDVESLIGLVQGGGKVDAQAVGIRAFGKAAVQIIRRIHRAQDEVRQLIANMSGLTVDEVRALPIRTLVSALSEIISMDGALDFLPSASE